MLLCMCVPTTPAGNVLGPAMGGFLAQPARKWPTLFPPGSFFSRYEYVLPCFAASSVALIGLLAGIFFLPVLALFSLSLSLSLCIFVFCCVCLLIHVLQEPDHSQPVSTKRVDKNRLKYNHLLRFAPNPNCFSNICSFFSLSLYLRIFITRRPSAERSLETLSEESLSSSLNLSLVSTDDLSAPSASLLRMYLRRAYRWIRRYSWRPRGILRHRNAYSEMSSAEKCGQQRIGVIGFTDGLRAGASSSGSCASRRSSSPYVCIPS
jgi:hypothetical protein